MLQVHQKVVPYVPTPFRFMIRVADQLRKERRSNAGICKSITVHQNGGTPTPIPMFCEEKASEVADMALNRRKFVDVHQSQGSANAEEAIKRIAAMCAVERRPGLFG